MFRRIELNVFEAVKQSVTTRQAAEHFRIRVGRNGMCVCPFHADKHPSMKVDRRFHCFGCGADGDVIDFVSRLEQASPKEAALLLAQAFSIPYEDKGPPRRRKPPQETGLCPQDAGRRLEPFVCGSPAKAGLCGLSAGHAALPGHGGTGGADRQLWKGSENH